MLVNDILTGFFSSFRGLREGDVVCSCYGGVMCSNFYYGERGLLSGSSVGSWNGFMNISYLLFVDNTSIFCWAKPRFVTCIVCSYTSKWSHV